MCVSKSQQDQQNSLGFCQARATNKAVKPAKLRGHETTTSG